MDNLTVRLKYEKLPLKWDCLNYSGASHTFIQKGIIIQDIPVPAKTIELEVEEKDKE